MVIITYWIDENYNNLLSIIKLFLLKRGLYSLFLIKKSNDVLIRLFVQVLFFIMTISIKSVCMLANHELMEILLPTNRKVHIITDYEIINPN